MDIKSVIEKANSLYHQLHELHIEFYKLWSGHVLFTWRWWVSLSMIVLPWVLWVIVRRKESTHRLLFVGFSVMLVSSLMDVVGIALELWSYPINVFPLMPEFIPFDISVLPVATMLLIQIFPRVNKYIKAAVYALSASFIFQPVSEWIGLYCNISWKYYYSAPLLFLIYLGADFIYRRDKFAK